MTVGSINHNVGCPKRTDLSEVNINTGTQSINTEKSFLIKRCHAVTGWFDASLTLTEDLQNQMREECTEHPEEGHWCDTFVYDTQSDFSAYGASDEDSEAGDDDLWCITLTPDSEELESVSSEEGSHSFGSKDQELDLSAATEHAWAMEDDDGEGDASSDHIEPSAHLVHVNHQSVSEASDSCSVMSSPLELLKQDVTTLLNLLMDDTFAHPYGTVAGSVA